MSQKKLILCQKSIHPGEIAHLALALPEQYSCSPSYMPIKIIHGTHPGPCLLLVSGMKGTELNGLEIIDRIIKETDPQTLFGTIIAIPVINVDAFIHYPRKLPTSFDISQCFPGDEEGTYGERIASLVRHEVLEKVDYCLELQTGGLNHNILPQVHCDFANAQSKSLARQFQAPVVTNVSLDKNTFRQTTEKRNIPLLVYQAGEAMRFDESAIHLGLCGIKNMMCSLKMTEESPVEDVKPIFSQDEDWILANKSGILRTSAQLGQLIEEGEQLGIISDPFGADLTTPVFSPLSGIIVGLNCSPFIHEGLPIFKIASFIDDSKAENFIESWDKEQPDSIKNEYGK